MTATELAQLVFANLNPEDTQEFAERLKTLIDSGHTAENKLIIANQLEAAGITITGIPCKRHPTL